MLQKSRELWLPKGNVNTKFFMLVLPIDVEGTRSMLFLMERDG